MGKKEEKKEENEDEEIPEEVRKHMDVKYTDERCPFCDSRIDEYGYCACGAAG